MERRLELGEILAKEAGKPYMKEAVWELDSVAYVYRGACDVAMHYYGSTMPIGTEPGYDDDLQITIHEPLGTLACIIPYNFPPAIWAFKTAAALAAGNTIVVKAPSYDPMTLLVLHEMLHEAGLPAGVAQCLTGKGSVVGDCLVDDPRIACVNFTGSTDAGLSIAATAAKHLTDYKFELGGNDPFIVFEDADMDLVVKEAEDQARNNRQCCTGSKRFLVHNSLKEEFIRRLSAELDKLVIGDPMDPKVNMGPMISERAARQVEEQVNLTVAQGARIVRGRQAQRRVLRAHHPYRCGARHGYRARHGGVRPRVAGDRLRHGRRSGRDRQQLTLRARRRAFLPEHLHLHPGGQEAENRPHRHQRLGQLPRGGAPVRRRQEDERQQP